MKPGDLVEITIEDIAFGGDGVGRSDGCVVFVPFVALGETVRVRIDKHKKSWAKGKLKEVITPAAERREAPCPYFGFCGGCQYQHLEYPAQIRLKTKQLRDTLERIGGLGDPNILDFITCPSEFGYRNRISVHHEEERIGFRSASGTSLVDIETCLLASEEVNAKLQHLRKKPGRREHYSLRAAHVPELGFYQSNDMLLEALQKLVADKIRPGNEVIECYAGSGFFAEAYADKATRVTLLEDNPHSMEEARKRLGSDGSVRYLEGPTESNLTAALEEIQTQAGTACCLVDPPRDGLSETVRAILSGDQALGQLLYLSCNPATLARDLKSLSATWKPVAFQPIDLFPQTSHFECLAVCERVTS